MRKALVVGIDYYQHIDSLRGCVNDARSVERVLERHADGSVNFEVRPMISADSQSISSRSELKEGLCDLFADDSEVALLYFAGHGYTEVTGGYLCTSDCRAGDDGLALSEVMTIANKSDARNKIIILDSCYSGIIGNNPIEGKISTISEGMTVLAASTENQYAAEEYGGGVFTNLLIDALGGAAANLLGDITPGSVYAHIDQSLGAWRQRPVFKANVKTFISLRKVQPKIALAELRRISEFFPEEAFKFQLDPAYEPCHSDADPVKGAKFRILQNYNRVNLLVPVGVQHMWNAAMESKVVELTALGEHYRRIAAEGLI